MGNKNLKYEFQSVLSSFGHWFATSDPAYSYETKGTTASHAFQPGVHELKIIEYVP